MLLKSPLLLVLLLLPTWCTFKLTDSLNPVYNYCKIFLLSLVGQVITAIKISYQLIEMLVHQLKMMQSPDHVALIFISQKIKENSIVLKKSLKYFKGNAIATSLVALQKVILLVIFFWSFSNFYYNQSKYK